MSDINQQDLDRLEEAVETAGHDHVERDRIVEYRAARRRVDERSGRRGSKYHDERGIPHNATAEFRRASQGNWDAWVPASGGQETPFTYRGRRYLYVYNPKKKKHAYLDLTTDLVLSDKEAQQLFGEALEELPEAARRWKTARGRKTDAVVIKKDGDPILTAWFDDRGDAYFVNYHDGYPAYPTKQDKERAMKELKKEAKRRGGRVTAGEESVSDPR